jgi:uncharacterized protein YjiS (DUF1127 family)
MDLLQHMIAWFIAWRLLRRQRKELLEFLASDHRAAADIGITPYEAQQHPHRHCEPTGPARSGRPDDKLREAIQRFGVSSLDCFVASAPRNDES